MIKCRRPSSLINNGSVKKGKERIVEIMKERGLNEGREEIGEKGLWKEKWKKIIFFLVFLTPYALFSFSITTHIPIVVIRLLRFCVIRFYQDHPYHFYNFD